MNLAIMTVDAAQALVTVITLLYFAVIVESARLGVFLTHEKKPGKRSRSTSISFAVANTLTYISAMFGLLNVLNGGHSTEYAIVAWIFTLLFFLVYIAVFIWALSRRTLEDK